MYYQNLRQLLSADLKSVGDRSGFLGFCKFYFFHPGFKAIVLYRVARWFYKHHVRIAPDLLIAHAWMKTGAELPYTADIGPGLALRHPVGVVIGSRCRIGTNCTIMQGVTLGTTWSPKNDELNFPVIGDNVVIGAGAKLLGGVTVGNNATIGANSVVLNNVPAGSVAVGIPARIV